MVLLKSTKLTLILVEKTHLCIESFATEVTNSLEFCHLCHVHLFKFLSQTISDGWSRKTSWTNSFLSPTLSQFIIKWKRNRQKKILKICQKSSFHNWNWKHPVVNLSFLSFFLSLIFPVIASPNNKHYFLQKQRYHSYYYVSFTSQEGDRVLATDWQTKQNSEQNSPGQQTKFYQ